jgi:hypothetical protein
MPDSIQPEETIPAPFGDYVIRFLLAGPAAAGEMPRDPATRAEMKSAVGRAGSPEAIAATWREHEGWLRATAVERGIQPTFRGQFFAEAAAKGTRR